MEEKTLAAFRAALGLEEGDELVLCPTEYTAMPAYWDNLNWEHCRASGSEVWTNPVLEYCNLMQYSHTPPIQHVDYEEWNHTTHDDWFSWQVAPRWLLVSADHGQYINSDQWTGYWTSRIVYYLLYQPGVSPREIRNALRAQRSRFR